MKAKRISIVALACVVLALGLSGCQKLRARDNLNKGVQAFKNARYAEAVEFFKQAVELDPTFPTARLYLATAYMQQYIPGAESPENLRMAQAAHDEFLRVLEQDPKNEVAIASIALLYFNQKKLDEAREWYLKQISVNPSAKEAHYTIGVIAWTKTFQPRMEARAKLGMKPEDPGPLKDRRVREALREKNLPIIEEGMQHLQKALEIDKEYDDAMAYLNLLYRERADLADTEADYKKFTDIADNWVQKTMETKKMKAARMPGGGLAGGQ
ncbi:MAG: tetratricopeptide repeat protein [Bryobacterales bacterium]|nr:tetratricopeptide repeat protein [Bryobacteraceae bacterium]MDW8353273.1 tetratricopeptide repeat protein [Bryobacterales bacterium]